MSEINEHDYISFTRIIRPAVKVKVRDAGGGIHDYVKEPAALIEASGSGLVKRVAKNLKRIDGEKLSTARVDTGGALGTVTAVLDDATIIGVQTRLDLGVDAVQSNKSVYDTTGDVA